MAKYSFTSYGVSKYGEIENTRIYNNVNLRAWSYDYRNILITWGSVTSDPADYIVANISSISRTSNIVTVTTSTAHSFIVNTPVTISGTIEGLNGSFTITSIPTSTTFTYTAAGTNVPNTSLDPVGTATVGRPTHWKLIKSYTGAANNPEDGIFVDGDVITGYRLSKIDFEDIADNREVTYSFWIFNGLKWINCGNARALYVDSTNSIDKVTKWIPRAWLNPQGDATGEADSDTDMYSFLSAFTFEYDKFRTELDLLFRGSNYKITPAIALKQKIQDLGFSYEPALGDQYHRSLYGSGNLINAAKGTSYAVEAYVTGLTHWGNTIKNGHNLMLDYNDSSFEESVGRWTASAGLFTNQKYSTSLTDLGVAITAPSPGLCDLLFPPRSTGFAWIHGHNAAVTLSLPGNINYGIPVKANTKYLFSGWFRVKEATKVGTVQTRIKWYNSSGTLISTESYSTALTGSTTWQEFNSGSTAGRNGKISPSTAVYASVDILFTPTNNQAEFLIDMLQFAEAKYSVEYQDARAVQIVLNGEQENLISNPSFENGTGGWYALNSNLIQEFSAPATSVAYKTCVGKLTATSTSGDRVALVSEWVPVEPGQNYTFSIYASGSARPIKSRIEYSIKQSADEQTEILSDGDGYFYPTIPYYVESESLTLSSTAQRISVSALAPALTVDGGTPLAKISLYTDSAQTNDVFYFDGAFLQKSSELNAFFTGDGAPSPANPIQETYFNVDDCRWETRNVLNFVSNPSFETVNNWTAGSGTTFTSVSEISPALYGNKQGKVSKAGGGSISTTVYLPYAAVGGEDMTVSAYIRNKAGTYSIGTTNQETATYVVSEANKDQWTRIHSKRILDPGETSFTLTISLSTGNGLAAVFYVDGVQAEFGRIPSRFTDPAEAFTVTRANLLNPAVNMYATKYENIGGGKSFYWSTYADKYTRLASTIEKVMPYGSTWAIVPGTAITEYPELSTSLITSASFENDLGSWVANSSTLRRTVARGSMFDEVTSHGVAFCRITSTGTTAFGITSDKITIEPGNGYYTSIAIKPENEDAFGVYTLTTKFYDSTNTLVLTKTKTLELRRFDRWAYASVYATGVETTAASYAKVSVAATPDTTEPGHTFHLDRVVFRE